VIYDEDGKIIHKTELTDTLIYNSNIEKNSFCWMRIENDEIICFVFELFFQCIN
jgi:hypothetical protein